MFCDQIGKTKAINYMHVAYPGREPALLPALPSTESGRRRFGIPQRRPRQVAQSPPPRALDVSSSPSVPEHRTSGSCKPSASLGDELQVITMHVRFPSRCCPSGTKGLPFSPGSGHRGYSPPFNTGWLYQPVLMGPARAAMLQDPLPTGVKGVFFSFFWFIYLVLFIAYI